MANIRTILYAAMGLMMLDAALEMGLIVSMVYWLHNRAGKAFEVKYQGGSFSLHGKPAGLLVNQGHTSNGAAGTALVLIGIGGILALWLRARADRKLSGTFSGFGKGWYHFWLFMTVVSTLLTVAAIIYTFILTYEYDGQAIDIHLASTLNNKPYPNYAAYPLHKWTPENWLDAVLKLPLTSSSDRSDINTNLYLMRAWRWNLFPLFAFELAVCVLAFLDARQERRATRQGRSMALLQRNGKRSSSSS